jgi:imidazolonepropionase-like amidohydrolase
VLRGELPLIIAADRYDDILTALRITAEFEVPMILLGGAESHRLAGELAQRAIPVIWGPIGAANRELEASRGTPETPSSLTGAGLRIAFQTGGIENVDGLLREARAAYAAGLPHEEALKGLTLYPALIFGVEADLGSLEAGKNANVVVFDGDPLDSPASAEWVFVRGIEVMGSGG